MPRARTTATLLTDVRARVAAPAANGLLSDAELLALADQEMRTELAALLIGARSEYWLADYTTPIVSGVSRYAMPPRALGMALRDVTVVDTAGREYNVSQVPADQRYLWSRGQTWAGNGPVVFTLETDAITLLPTPTAELAGWTLRMRYYVRPSELTLLANASWIDDIISPTELQPSEQDPPGNLTVDGFIDIVPGVGMHVPTLTDLRLDDWSVFVVTLSVALTSAEQALIYASGNRVGERLDYICEAGKTVYPQLPESMWPLLVALTCRAYCEAIGDMRGMEAAAAMYERKKSAALGIMTPRVDGEVMRPVPMHTPLRGGRSRRGGW
jgi:hypothetical protein